MVTVIFRVTFIGKWIHGRINSEHNVLRNILSAKDTGKASRLLFEPWPVVAIIWRDGSVYGLLRGGYSKHNYRRPSD